MNSTWGQFQNKTNMMTRIFNLSFSIFICTICLSCAGGVSRNKYADLLKRQAEIDAKLITLTKHLIDKTKEEVFKGELAPENGETIMKNLQNSMARLSESQSLNKRMLNDLNTTKGAAKKTIAKKAINHVNVSASENEKLQKNLQFLLTTYGTDNLKIYETAAFFPSGTYQIPEKHIPVVKEKFANLFDEIVNFTQTHNGVSTVAIINTKGYADEQDFNLESDFVKSAAQKLKIENPSRKELNKLLSKLRAESLASLLQSTLNNRMAQLDSKNVKSVNINPEGVGEEYPNPNIKNYQKIDDRRRIVIVFWNVIPVDFIK
jgi:hypothetical protein